MIRRRVRPLGRLGRFTAAHLRLVALAWVVVAVVLGVVAPKVETALSGAGWQANGSESVRARTLVERDVRGLSSSALLVVVHSDTHRFGDPQFTASVARVERLLRASSAVSTVVTPRRGASVSRDGRTAVVQAGARRDPTGMVKAADDLMTIVGLVAAAGSLYIGSRVAEISIWAMNLAVLFALALGIDYALFIVHRFRGALLGSKLTVEEAVEQTMDTAGKAVLFSGAPVLVSLSAARGDGRRGRALRAGDLRRRGGDGRGVLHLRALRAADPRRPVLLDALLVRRPHWLGRLLPDVRFSHS